MSPFVVPLGYVRFMATAAFDSAVAQLAAAVDELLAADVSGLERGELIAAARVLETQRRRLEAVDQRLIVQAQRSRLAAECAAPSVAAVWAEVLRLDPGEARRRETRALDCGPRQALDGERLEPTLPRLAASIAAGEVSAAQADVIIDALEQLPDRAPVEAGPVAEGVLLAAAAHEPPRLLRRTARELLARLDPDGPEPDEQHRQRRRALTLITEPDGWARPSGALSPELTAHLQALLDALAAPQPISDDGMPDPRTAPQRRHDALLEAVRRILRSGALPDCGGVPVTVLATTTIRELTDAAGLTPRSELGGSGLAELGHGQSITAGTLLTMACEAQVVPVVFGDGGGVLAYGRQRRLATAGQRLALAARDKGCCFPGCDRPPAWCEVHHVTEWIEGGSTDLDNLCLVCTFHHRHFGPAGWRVDMLDGVPWWTPPPYLDRQRRPRRNTAHHRPEIVFRQPSAA